MQQVHTFKLSFHVHHCDSTVLSHCVPQVGSTALMWASYSGHTAVVQLLLTSGAQVNLQDAVVRHKHCMLDSCHLAFLIPQFIFSKQCIMRQSR